MNLRKTWGIFTVFAYHSFHLHQVYAQIPVSKMQAIRGLTL